MGQCTWFVIGAWLSHDSMSRGPKRSNSPSGINCDTFKTVCQSWLLSHTTETRRYVFLIKFTQILLEKKKLPGLKRKGPSSYNKARIGGLKRICLLGGVRGLAAGEGTAWEKIFWRSAVPWCLFRFYPQKLETMDQLHLNRMSEFSRDKTL